MPTQGPNGWDVAKPGCLDRAWIGILWLALSLVGLADEPPAGRPVLQEEDLLGFGKSWSQPPLPKCHWLPNSRGLWHLTGGWLELVELANPQSRRLAPAVFASFSPDASRVAIVQTNAGTADLWLRDTAGQIAQKLAPVERQGLELRWQHDGQRFNACWVSKGRLQVVSCDALSLDVSQVADISLGDAEPTVVWSHDATRLAFLHGPEGGRQLHVVSCQAGHPHSLAMALNDTWDKALDPVWSPDDREIAVVGYHISEPVVSRVLPVVEGSSARVSAGTGDRRRVLSEIQTFSADGSGRRHELKADRIVQHLQWSPNGGEFLYVARFRAEENFNSMGPMELRRLDRHTGRDRAWLQGRALGDASFDGAFSYSPDRRSVAVIVRPYDGFYVPRRDLEFLDLKTGRLTSIAGNLPIWGGSFCWSADGTTLYLGSRGDAAYRHVHAVSSQGQARRLTHGPRNHSSPVLSPDKTRFFCTTEDQAGRRDIRVFEVDGSPGQVLIQAPSGAAAKFAQGEISEVTWRSGDGTRSHGTLIKPVGFVSGRRYPLLVILHGGPASGISLQGPVLFNTPLEKHFWAGRGFLVFSPEFRSSGLLGRKSVRRFLQHQDLFARDQDDVVSGVDQLVREGLADPARVAVTGHSWGAYVVNWLITHTDRFRAAVSFEGEADYGLAYGTDSSLGGNTYWEGLFQGKPWEKPENYRRNSPVHSLKVLKTPTLFVNGADGAAVFHNQFLHTALLQHGVDTQLVVYQGEGHSIDRPANQRDLLQRTVAWIDAHLSPAPPPASRSSAASPTLIPSHDLP